MIPVGTTYVYLKCVVVVTEGPGQTRRPGSTLGNASDINGLDYPVYTLAVLHDDGRVVWPVERLEETLECWTALRRRV